MTSSSDIEFGRPLTPQRAAELDVISRFVSLVVDSSRSPRQRERIGRAAGIPITDAGAALLRVLSRHGPLSVNDLAARIGLDQSTVSRQLAALESLGLVNREIDPHDRRSRRVAVAEAGQRLMERTRLIALNDFDAALTGWTDTERAQFSALLGRFQRALLDAEVDETGWSVARPDNTERAT